MIKCNCCNNHFKSQKAVNGHLGNIKSLIKRKELLASKVINYYKYPKICPCGSIITYDKQLNKFCSHSCSASITNTTRNRKVNLPNNCKFCKMPCKRNYCCDEHKQKFEWKQFKQGLIKGRPRLKRLLLLEERNECSICHYNMWMNKPIPLQLDHVDGNASNNLPNNLRLLCPTCHAQTDTYGSRNKGKGRKSLRNKGIVVY